MSSLTLFYIAQPGPYAMMGSVLLASIRQFLPESVKVVGYCPEHLMDELHPSVLKAHEMLDAEIRPMKTDDMWDSPYPHGNKILACLQPRDTEYSAFIDSDVMFLRPTDPASLFRAGHVSCSPAAWMGWTGQDVWERIYPVFGMDVPEQRITLMRNKGLVVPYFSSGFVVFPEAEGAKGRFADVWYETARILDRQEDIPRRRPYLDQLSLPVAIRRAGLEWNELSEEQHYIMGGKMKGQALPADKEIQAVHYRNDNVLRAAGLLKTKRQIVKQAYGVKFITRLAPDAPAAENHHEGIEGPEL